MIKLFVLKRLARKIGLDGLSQRDLDKLFRAWKRDRVQEKQAPTGCYVEKDSNFGDAIGDVLGRNPGVEREFKNLMGGFKYNEAAHIDQETQFRNYAQTAFFRATSRDTFQKYQENGVTHIEIRAHLDDRTTAICRDMHGRVFKITDFKDPDGENLVPNADFFYPGLPTEEIPVILPPYHFNCRTTFIEYVEPRKEIDRIAEDARNCHELTPAQKNTMQSVAEKATWKNTTKEVEHFVKHGLEQEQSQTEYFKEALYNIRQPGRDIIYGINTASANLHAYYIREIRPDKYLLTIVDLSNGYIATSFYLYNEALRKNIKKRLIKTQTPEKWNSNALKNYLNLSKGTDIMKTKGIIEEMIEDSRPTEIGFINTHLRIYKKHFLLLGDIEAEWWDNYIIISRRIGLYIANNDGMLNNSQKAALIEADRINIRKFWNGEFNHAVDPDVVDMIKAFFGWLERYYGRTADESNEEFLKRLGKPKD